MANSVGTAYLTLVPKIGTSAFSKAKRDFEKHGREAGEQGGRAAGEGFMSKMNAAINIAAIAAIGKQVADALLQPLNAYADYEQLVGGIESMFAGDEAAIARVADTAAGAYQTLTMSANEYYSSFMGAYPLIAGSLQAGEDGIGITNDLLTLESDLANTFGYDISQAATAINWALKGTYSYLDNLNIGIVGTAEGFLEAANASGILGREISSLDELTASEKIAVIQYYADQYGVLGKTAEEALSTIQGSLKATQSAWQNLLIGMADDNADIDQLFNNLVDSAGALIGNVAPRIGQIFTSIGELMWQNFPVILDQIGRFIPQVAGFIYADLPLILNKAMEFLPQVAGFMGKVINTIVLSLPNIITQFSTWIQENIPTIINLAIDLFSQIAAGIPDAVVALAIALPQIIESIVTTLVAPENIQKMWDVAKNLIQGFIDGVNNMIGSIVDAAKGIFDSFVGSVREFLGIHSPSRVFRELGGYTMQGFAMGIEDNTGLAVDAVESAMRGVEGASIGNLAATVHATTQLEAAQQKPMNVYLDTGALVGGISRQMDARLGRMTLQAVR